MKKTFAPSFFFCVAIGAGPTPSANQWLDYIEHQVRGERSRSEITMTIKTETWERTLQIKGDTEGKDKSIIFIQAPAKEKGVGTLRLGGNMWNWFPKLKRKVIVSPSMLLASWMGSDFTNDDLLKASSMADDYGHTFLPDETMNGEVYRVIENRMKPTSKVMWPRIVTLASKKDCLPREHRYYDKRDKLIRSMKMSDITKFDGHILPRRWEMVPVDGEGKKTIMVYRDIKFNLTFPANHFSLQKLTGQ